MRATPTGRLAPLPLAHWAPGSREILCGHVKAADRYLSDTPECSPLPNVLGLLGHHPELGGAWLAYNGVLLDNPTLDPRLRELMILRISWRTRAAYEWAQHVVAARAHGITDDEITRIGLGADAGVWTPLESSLLAAIDQLIDHHQVDDSTWALLEDSLEPRQLLEALFVAGTYVCLAMVFNSVALPLDPSIDLTAIPELPELEDQS
ncbi:carboxymuconolactone decarboxylase family protein [Rhodococcus sp. NPDC060086]|uniref:carboxymuconolactone decarboxylase family protein n=1 Tax=Rhodococcus sp. NPDC060086 TaxID=3347055 RepID=UPI00366396DF